jgi:hypothetical protein
VSIIKQKFIFVLDISVEKAPECGQWMTITINKWGELLLAPQTRRKFLIENLFS